MINIFNTALQHVLKHEGGYAHHPRDPGGRTNLGVTQRVWEEWTGKPSSEEEMRSLTVEQVTPLYKQRFWDKIKGDELPVGVDYVVFDFAVNAGVARSASTLQAVVGTWPDGIIGPQTLFTTQQLDPADVVKMFSDERLKFYKSLSTYDVFGVGWTRRIEDARKTGVEMANGTKS